MLLVLLAQLDHKHESRGLRKTHLEAFLARCTLIYTEVRQSSRRSDQGEDPPEPISRAHNRCEVRKAGAMAGNDLHVIVVGAGKPEMSVEEVIFTRPSGITGLLICQGLKKVCLKSGQGCHKERQLIPRVAGYQLHDSRERCCHELSKQRMDDGDPLGVAKAERAAAT